MRGLTGVDHLVIRGPLETTERAATAQTKTKTMKTRATQRLLARLAARALLLRGLLGVGLHVIGLLRLLRMRPARDNLPGD